LLAKKWDAVVPGNSIYFNFIYILKVLFQCCGIPVDSTWRGVAWRGVGVGDLPDRYPHRRLGERFINFGIKNTNNSKFELLPGM
jgi:hypothetical protein